MARPNRYRADVARLAHEEYSPKEIAAELGCTEQTVRANWPPGLPTPYQKSLVHDRSIDIATIMGMRDDGMTIKAIADTLGMPYSTVQRWLSQHQQEESQ